MDEQKSPNGMMKGKVCDCNCGCGWPSGHRCFRVVLVLILLALAFAVGVKVGEVKSYFHRDGYGGGYFYQRYMPVQMMPGGMMNGAPMMNATPTTGGAPSAAGTR